MKSILPALTSLALAAVPAAAEAPMKVYVTAAKVQERKEVDEATKSALKARKDAAREVRKAKEDELKAAYGKKKEAWPPEKQEEFFTVDEAAALAEADYEYRKVEIKGINDSVQDVIESIQGKGLAGRKDRVALASSADEADLVVEVRARRSGKTLPTQFKPDRCYVLFSLGPGGKVDAQSFARVPANYRPGKFGAAVYRLASPKPESPVFLFESYNGGGNEFGCWGAAGNAAATAIDKFIQDNGALLTSPLAAQAGEARPGLNSCLLVSAGTGTKANSDKVTKFWQTVNAEIAKSLVEQLTKDGVAARLDVVPQDAAFDKVEGLIALALARERCNQLMQFVHQLGGGSGPGAYFAFEAAVLGVEEAGGGFTLNKEAFRKNYRFALTDEVLRTLSVSEFAAKLKGDLASAGVVGGQPAK